MRKRFLESRTYEQAYAIAEKRIEDAIALYDNYTSKGDGYFKERVCPFCGEKEYTNEVKFHERYGVARCVSCNSLYVNPVPVQEVLNDYYDNYECNKMLEDVYKKRAQKDTNAILDTRLETIVEYIYKIPRDTVKILEIGCSNGSFLTKLRKRMNETDINKKIEYIGVDANKNAILANEDKELNLIHSTIEDYLQQTKDSFDIVWHTELVEHIIDPFSLFQKLYAVMNKDSYMIFTTPNSFSLEMNNLSYNIPRVLACNIFPPMHLNAFSTINVSHFALRSNFCIEKIETPGFFDVEIFEMQKEYVTNELLKAIPDMTEEQKEYLQDIIVMSRASSHMQCVLSKRK